MSGHEILLTSLQAEKKESARSLFPESSHITPATWSADEICCYFVNGLFRVSIRKTRRKLEGGGDFGDFITRQEIGFVLFKECQTGVVCCGIDVIMTKGKMEI